MVGVFKRNIQPLISSFKELKREPFAKIFILNALQGYDYAFVKPAAQNLKNMDFEIPKITLLTLTKKDTCHNPKCN